MTDKKQQIENLLNLLKIDIDSHEEMYKDFDSIIEMFNQLEKVHIEGNAEFNRRSITISELRDDKQIFEDFRQDLRGKYIKVPSVSKKGL